MVGRKPSLANRGRESSTGMGPRRDHTQGDSITPFHSWLFIGMAELGPSEQTPSVQVMEVRNQKSIPVLTTCRLCGSERRPATLAPAPVTDMHTRPSLLRIALLYCVMGDTR